MFARLSRAFAVLLAGSLVLAACTTYDPYTREEKTAHATRGAVIGGLAGAAIGALTNTSSGEQAAKNALIGAGIGALGGAAVGGYMDRQERELRERLDRTGVRVIREGDNIRLIMPGNVTFETDQADIQRRFYPVLSDVALVLDEFDRSYVTVIGHTDSTGSDAYNQRLSEDRAESVASFLINDGVMPERLIVRGRGERDPIATNATPEGRQQNRRVEINIEPFVS